MPSVTATVGQLLRYGLVGGFVFFLLQSLRPDALRPYLRLRYGEDFNEWLVAIFILVTGTLVYGVHRTIFYPWFHRLAVLSIFDGMVTGGPWRWYPYRWTELDVRMQAAALSTTRPPQLAGWGAEIHFMYMTLEVLLVSLLIWPGWPVSSMAILAFASTLLVAGFMTWTWNRALIEAEQASHDEKVRLLRPHLRRPPYAEAELVGGILVLVMVVAWVCWAWSVCQR